MTLRVKVSLSLIEETVIKERTMKEEWKCTKRRTRSGVRQTVWLVELWTKEYSTMVCRNEESDETDSTTGPDQVYSKGNST